MCHVIFHEYTRKDKPKIWTDNPTYSDKDAFEKVKFYIGLVENDSKISDSLKKSLKKFGLGNIRTLDDYYNFSGIILISFLHYAILTEDGCHFLILPISAFSFNLFTMK